MSFFEFIQDHAFYIPFITLGWNILSRVIFAVAVIVPAVIGTMRFIYHITYAALGGSYLLIRKLYRLTRK